ncbi:hypothetical protein KNU66_gp03 [Gordonia phage McKinley]|uniref:Uncharacterized protein n=1 Tax=Gordonia phage McKinley TaxID=2588507 RepID=A0A4Y6EMY0_9CAUD|nr:hypothetical protein KNU66_gp03 [Gordonia phage McKinley]QDF19425.1 hypothetical protein SEA_MCKINLEY_3 [Gordonia phage McKinley]
MTAPTAPTAHADTVYAETFPDCEKQLHFAREVDTDTQAQVVFSAYDENQVEISITDADGANSYVILTLDQFARIRAEMDEML